MRLIEAGLAVGSTVVFTLWLVRGWGGEWTTLVMDDLATILAPGLATAACLGAARRSHGRARLSWYLFAASALSWGLGQVAWSYFELVLREAPFPSIADVGFLGAIPFAIGALLVRVSSIQRRATFARAILDGLIISLSILFISWDLVLGPIVRAGGDSLLVQSLTLAYPLGDVVLLAVVIFTLTRGFSGPRASLLLVGGGLAAISFADSVFAYFSLTGNYETGLYADSGWFLGYLLVAMGARAFAGNARVSVEAHAPTRLSVALPYIPVGLSLVLAVLQIVRERVLDPVLWGVGVTLWIAVIGRQLATLFEDIALVRSLEDKVDERTTELRDAGIALERRERHFRSLVQNASDLILVTDREGFISYASPSVGTLLGRDPDDLLGENLSLIVHPNDVDKITDVLIAAEVRPTDALSVEWRFLHAERDSRVMQTAVTAQVVEGAINGLVLNSRDVTERRQLEERLRYEALHDALTGLPNRSLFRDRLDHAIASQNRIESHMGLLFIDIDDFKTINDTADHSVGDSVLGAVGERLGDAIRPGDTVARLGGDEFAVLLANLDNADESVVIAERILERLSDPFNIDGREIRISASIGISTAFGSGVTADEVLRHSDLAMYIAKGKGKATYQIFEPDMHDALVERMALKSELARGVEADEFLLHYQPLVDLNTGSIKGVEALMRWMHPRLGLVPPASFIPLAEESGAIIAMGKWALSEACRQTVAWDRGDRCAGLDVSVNLSARQLAAPGLLATVSEVLDETGIEPSRVILEITESVLMEDIEAIVEVLHDLRALGVRLAIDDFGTGYSSLAYLARLPVQIMKIDRTFVNDLAEEGRTALVRSIRQLATELDMEVVAEGIESDEVALELQALGCEYGQGYWMSRPLPPVELESFIGRLVHPGAELSPMGRR
ncbi:MAG TPA: EAL domain-containing protein [Acidimicrobiales bacterium]